MLSQVYISEARTANSLQDYSKFISRTFTSRKEFVNEYKRIYFGTAEAKDLYHHILRELKRTTSEGNIDTFKKLSSFTDYISHVENEASLKTFYGDADNPIKSTNLVILACQNNKVKILEYMFSKDGNILNNLSVKVGRNSILPNDEDETGHNAFYYAIRSGSAQLIDVLISKWNDNYFAAHSDELDIILSKVYEELTPMHTAAFLSQIDVVKVLLNYGATYNAIDISSNKTPLENTKDTDVIHLLTLVEKLFKAVKDNSSSEVNKFIKEGAIVNAKNAKGETPLHIAARKGYESIVDILLNNKCKPNAVDKEGFAPIHYSAKFSHIKVLKILLAKGAKYNACSHNGKTPFDFAEDKSIISLIKLVSECFKNVINGNFKVIDDLNKVKDLYTIKAVMNARDNENKSLIVVAMLNNFPKVQQLKEIFHEDISKEVHAALALVDHDKCQKALSILRNVLKKRIEILGSDNPGTLDIQVHIAFIVYTQGYYQEALGMYEEILPKQESILGFNCKDALKTRNFIALVYYRLGRNEEALIIYKEVIKRQKEIFQPDDIDCLNTQLHMALVLDGLGKYEEALSINRAVFIKFKEILGAYHQYTLRSQNNIAMVLFKLKNNEEALKIYKEVYEKRKIALGIYHSDTLRTLHNMAFMLAEQNKFKEALESFKEILNAQKKHLGSYHVDTMLTQYNMAIFLFARGRLMDAYKAYKEGFEQRNAILGSSHFMILDSVKKIESIYILLKQQGYGDTDINLYLNNDLNKAANNGDLKMVQQLIKIGADVNEEDIDGRAPMHFAVNNACVDIVNILMKNGSDVTQVTCKGNTPLHTAASKGYVEVAEVLLQHINSENLFDFVDAKTTLRGTTSLHIASRNGSLDIVKTLLKYGATYDIKNKDGKTPLDLSKDKNIINLLKLIQDLFVDSENNNVKFIRKLIAVKPAEFRTIANVRCNTGKTLIQVAIKNQHQHRDLVIKLIEWLQNN